LPAAGGQLNNRYLKSNIALQWLLDNPPDEDDPYSPQTVVRACNGQHTRLGCQLNVAHSPPTGLIDACSHSPASHLATLPAPTPTLQRGIKRHACEAVTAQAYVGAAVARTATGQFAPALNSNKRRRADGGGGGSGSGQLDGAAGDAEYPGLPSGMKRPSLQVSGSVGGWVASGGK
jgi:hypothetical protein